VLFVALSGTLVASFVGRHDDRSTVSAGAEAPGGGVEAKVASQVKSFYDQTRLAFSPLLGDVQQIKLTLRTALEEAETPSASLTDLVAPWAEHAATARDLVGRLVPPAGTEGEQAQALYQSAAMLYRESVQTLARTPKIVDVTLRHETARAGLRIFELADRVLDQGNRVLALHGPIQPDLRTLPAEVPDFSKENLQPGAVGPVTPEGSGFAEKNEPQVSAPDWSARQRPPLEEAMASLRRAAGTYGDMPLTQAVLGELAAEFDAAGARLGESVPDSPVGREGDLALRLALLVQAESLRTIASPAQDGAIPVARRLRLIGDRLWSLGTDLLDRADVTVPQAGVGDPGLDRSLLFQGGVFNGNPPPLHPGDAPDAGVPGGLKLPDPNRIFSP
jgi:hypothetical protein